MGLFSRKPKQSERSVAARKIPAAGGRAAPSVIRPEPGQRLFQDVPVWFERMGDIPGLGAQLPTPPSRATLLGCAERPWIYAGKHADNTGEFRLLMWPGSKGFGQWTPSDFGHNWSPAQRLYVGVEQAPGRTPAQIKADLWPTLERPGVGVDYHFLLQGAVEELWKIRDSDPDARSALIEVATIDWQLFEAFPECMLIEPDRPGQYLSSKSLERLAAVHEQLGDLESAFNVTSFAVRYGQMDARHRRLAKKLGHTVTD